MIIYVITDGEYSDYHIERVFLDIDKAYTFARLNNMEVEEWETSDEKYSIPSETFYRIAMEFEIYKDAIGHYSQLVTRFDISEVPPEKVEKEGTLTDFLGSGYYNLKSIEGVFIRRFYSTKKFDKLSVIDKTQKIGYDICAMVENLIEENGGNPKNIDFKKLLGGKIND